METQIGLNVKVKFSRGSIYALNGTLETTLHNVTEIHSNYNNFILAVPDNRIAFESDVHGTGITYDAGDIVEYEATIADRVAEAF